MRRSATTVTPWTGRTEPITCGQLGQPGVEQLVRDAELADALDEGRVHRGDLREGEARCGLLVGEPELGELGGNGVGRHPVELVDDLHHGGRVGHAEAEVEPLEHLAVADLQRQLRDRQPDRAPPP